MNKALAIAEVVIKELYRRKDFYVLLVLTGVITVLLGTVSFFNDPKIVRYLKEVCLLLIWISSLVICITTAARQIPSEKESRTIFPLLAKPVSRWHVILGKFLGCWLACAIALIVFYGFFAVVAESRGSGENSAVSRPSLASQNSDPDHDQPHSHEEDVHRHEAAATGRSNWLNYFQAFWLHWCMLGTVTALVLLGSVVFSAPSSNTAISFISVLGVLLLGEHLHKVALRQTEPTQMLLTIVYFFIPHLEWFDIRDRLIYDHSPVPWTAMGLATAYAAAYAALFLFITWLLFRRKELTT